jgi:hypothetical protein
MQALDDEPRAFPLVQRAREEEEAESAADARIGAGAAGNAQALAESVLSRVVAEELADTLEMLHQELAQAVEMQAPMADTEARQRGARGAAYAAATMSWQTASSRLVAAAAEMHQRLKKGPEGYTGTSAAGALASLGSSRRGTGGAADKAAKGLAEGAAGGAAGGSGGSGGSGGGSGGAGGAGGGGAGGDGADVDAAVQAVEAAVTDTLEALGASASGLWRSAGLPDPDTVPPETWAAACGAVAFLPALLVFLCSGGKRRRRAAARAEMRRALRLCWLTHCADRLEADEAAGSKDFNAVLTHYAFDQPGLAEALRKKYDFAWPAQAAGGGGGGGGGGSSAEEQATMKRALRACWKEHCPERLAEDEQAGGKQMGAILNQFAGDQPGLAAALRGKYGFEWPKKAAAAAAAAATKT